MKYQEVEKLTFGEMMQRVEMAMGFKLYEWQKQYIAYGSIAFFPEERRIGRTTAHILRMLLTSTEPIYINDIVPDECHGRMYAKLYKKEVCKIRDKLVSSGIQIPEIKKGMRRDGQSRYLDEKTDQDARSASR